MAHWIIEDHGFGGQFYKCSNCGDAWCDIYRDVSMEENCPSCGEVMDNELIEYKDGLQNSIASVTRKLDRIKWYNPENWTISTRFRYYAELNAKLVQLTGYSVEKVVELFAAGYTLEPPKYDSKPMSTLMKLEEGGD